MSHLVPLHCLRTGERAVVGELFGDANLLHRLHELGLCQGADVEMVNPGAPCIIRVAGQKLCFRGQECASVLVIPAVTT